MNETVDMTWFRSFATHTHRRNEAFIALSPWSETPYLGANLTPALRQDSQISLVDAQVLTPEEWKVRHRDQTRKFRENMNVVQKSRQTQYVHSRCDVLRCGHRPMKNLLTFRQVQ